MQNTWIIQFKGTSYTIHYIYPTIMMHISESIMTAKGKKVYEQY